MTKNNDLYNKDEGSSYVDTGLPLEVSQPFKDIQCALKRLRKQVRQL